MKLKQWLVCCGLCAAGLSAQGAPFWSEDFNGYSDGSLTNGGWVVSESPAEAGAVVITNGHCSLERVVSTNGVSGYVYMHRDMSDTLGYETTLRENDKTISWGIQILDTQFNPGGNYSTKFQYGYVLAASSSNFLEEGCGYFLSTDADNGDDFLCLRKFDNGLRNGTVESVIRTEFELGWSAAYDSASVRVDYDPVSSVWRLYADRNSGIEPSSLTNLTGSIQADSAYTANPMPYLGLMFNFRSSSPTYRRALDFDSLSLWPSSQQAVPRISASDGGGVETDYFIDLVEVRVSDYVVFLNQTQYPQGLSVQSGQVRNTSGDVYCSIVDGDPRAMIAYDDNQGFSEKFSAVIGKEDHPMVFVSWFGAAAYCNQKSQNDGLAAVYDEGNGWNVTTNRGYRLPTEAEWVKAAAWQPELQTNTLYGTASNLLTTAEANFLNSGDSGETNTVRTLPVASYSGSSTYALRDSSGNVWEWCHDFLNTTQTNAATDPRAVRGGGWGNLRKDITTEVRSGNKPEQMNDSVGFRTVIIVE